MDVDEPAVAAQAHEDDGVYSDVDSEGFVADMRAYGVAQALPLQDEGMDADAAAYLRAVREEAARIPHVCAAARREPEPAAPVPAPADHPESCPPEPGPMHDWTCTVIDNFVAARREVQSEHARGPAAGAPALPSLADREGWQALIGREDFQPFSATLACMDNSLAAACLTELARGHGGGAPLPRHTALWLYGLMVRLEKPVHPDVACVLRQIAKLARERRDVGAGGAAEVAMFDTLLVLAGGFFGQDAHMAPSVDEYLVATSQLGC